tara:strand:+ start:39 stop:284 length:246 start_codon:yes stop_codon:yes gene_type:complete
MAAVEWLVQQLRNGKEFNNNLIQQAKEIEKEQMIEFANWLDKLTPSQRVSVWSKDGSASGLFTMDNEQLFEQFKKVTTKSE